MDITRLYQDFNIEYVTEDEDHRHSRQGWINTACPFCTGNAGYHLGYNINDNYFVCFRCGAHPPIKTISALLKSTYSQVVGIISTYGVNQSILKQKPLDKKPFSLPSNLQTIDGIHKQYLLNRNFNVAKIIKQYNLSASGVVSSIGGISYKQRLIIPYYWNGEIVSFDARDVTEKQTNKYQGCPKAYEAIERKKILYGRQEEWTDTGICVEGTTDVWRLGKQAFAVSGIKYTPPQVRIMANTFKKIAVVFDDDPQAIIQANKLVADLRFRGVKAWRVIIKNDPAAMSDKDAKKLVKYINSTKIKL